MNKICFNQGLFKSLHDTHTHLDKKKCGDGPPDQTEREQWVKVNFQFLKTVVCHHAEPIKSISINKNNVIVITKIIQFAFIFALYFALYFINQML